MVPVLYKYVFT